LRFTRNARIIQFMDAASIHPTPGGSWLSKEIRMSTTTRTIAAASNGRAAVAVCVVNGAPAVLRYAPLAIGAWENRDEFAALAARAAEKLGFRRDRRCAQGWRKVAGK